MSNQMTGTQSVFNMVLPSAPTIVPQYVDLRSIAETEIDLSQLVDNGTIDFISGAWIDNSANALPLNIKSAGSNQNVIVPANYQGYFPLLVPNAPKFTIYCASSPALIIPVIFYNVPLLPFLYNSGGASVSASATIIETDLTLDGSNQTAVIANGASKYLLIYNDPANSPVTVNIAGGDATATGFILAPGGNYENTVGIANAVTISGTAADIVQIYAGA